jgi:hypothetical protein
MQWTGERNGHRTIIREIGDDTLFATCVTCDEVLGRLTKEEYPKWRIAFHKAEAIVREHTC